MICCVLLFVFDGPQWNFMTDVSVPDELDIGNCSVWIDEIYRDNTLDLFQKSPCNGLI